MRKFDEDLSVIAFAIREFGLPPTAEMGDRFLNALEANERVIARNVTGNLLERHIKPIFG